MNNELVRVETGAYCRPAADLFDSRGLVVAGGGKTALPLTTFLGTSHYLKLNDRKMSYGTTIQHH